MKDQAKGAQHDRLAPGAAKAGAAAVLTGAIAAGIEPALTITATAVVLRAGQATGGFGLGRLSAPRGIRRPA
jgi:hypothetical protein